MHISHAAHCLAAQRKPLVLSFLSSAEDVCACVVCSVDSLSFSVPIVPPLFSASSTLFVSLCCSPTTTHHSCTHAHTRTNTCLRTQQEQLCIFLSLCAAEMKVKNDEFPKSKKRKTCLESMVCETCGRRLLHFGQQSLVFLALLGFAI